MYAERADEAWSFFSVIEGVIANKPQGAFYMTVLFADGFLNSRQTLPIADPKVKRFIEDKVKDVEEDKRFVYYLLGSTGICVVPLTGFCCRKKGFRLTLLEMDDEKRRWTWQTIADSIRMYFESTEKAMVSAN